MEIVRHLPERVIPGHCLLCGERAGAEGLCPGCSRDLPLRGGGCYACGAGSLTGALCGRCRLEPPGFDRLLAAYDYRFPVDRLIHAFKYHNNLLVARALTPQLCRRILRSGAPLPERLIPVPLHRARLYGRGYNQALEIARVLERQLAVPVDSRLVRRRRATRDQARLGSGERRRNVARAFSLAHPCDLRSVAIVDDVVTTGATAGALARLLRTAGVETVQVWALARASE